MQRLRGDPEAAITGALPAYQLRPLVHLDGRGFGPFCASVWLAKYGRITEARLQSGRRSVERWRLLDYHHVHGQHSQQDHINRCEAGVSLTRIPPARTISAMACRPWFVAERRRVHSKQLVQERYAEERCSLALGWRRLHELQRRRSVAASCRARNRRPICRGSWLNSSGRASKRRDVGETLFVL